MFHRNPLHSLHSLLTACSLFFSIHALGQNHSPTVPQVPPQNEHASEYTDHITSLQKYQQGDSKAAYELMRKHVENPSVTSETLWNTGSYAFQVGDFSTASLLWEAALRKGLFSWSAPYWLEQARAQINPSAVSAEPGDTYLFLMSRLPGLWFLALLSGVSALTAVLGPVSMRRTLLVAAAIVLITGGMKWSVSRNDVGFVIADTAALHAGAGESFPVIGSARKGDRFIYLRTQDAWANVETRQGTALWLKKDALAHIQSRAL